MRFPIQTLLTPGAVALGMVFPVVPRLPPPMPK